ncbi:hypothetical protein EV1_008840 [Malus domestica]|uniref:pentatricopeptide repeat-containing protein At2g20710, mitochondrial-like n=1 Tax=Malus domestica TaxID=3750 RepID=UPI0010A9BE81|nr:pentatricopeptide repeat-containing protein At2g20710, mitochondrial-like [Malus domestica]
MNRSRLTSLFNFYSRFGFRNVPGVSLYSTETYARPYRESWRGTLNTLYRRISRSGDPAAPITPILDKWVEEGRTAHKDALVTIIKELRQYKKHKHALEVSMWVSDKRYFELTIPDVAIRLDLIGKVHGIKQAEDYFNNIPKQLKGRDVYCALLNVFAHAKLVEKAEEIMQTMRDLGFARTPLSYNILLNLYYQSGNTDKFNVLMSEMEERGIGRDKYTYCIQLNVCAAASDLEGIDKVMAEWESNPEVHMDWDSYTNAANGYTKTQNVKKALAMLEKAEKLIPSSKRKRGAYEYLMTQYAALGEKDSVMRLWELYKKHLKIYNRGYISIITSVLKVGDIESAEKIYDEWESKNLTPDIRIPNFLISAYTKKGLVDKAESIINRIVLKGGKPDAKTWYYLAKGYLNHDQTEKTVESMRKALSVVEGSRWTPDRDVVAACMTYMKQKADVEGSEEFIRLLGEKCSFPESIQEKLLAYINNEDSVTVEIGDLEWDHLNRVVKEVD